MNLQMIGAGHFTQHNVALQGNLVIITFPLAFDRTRPTTDPLDITYLIRYITRPLYCGGTTVFNYTQSNTDDSSIVSTFQVVSNLIVENGMATTRMMLPAAPTDIVIAFQVQALDDVDTHTGPIVSSQDFFALVNRNPRLNFSTINWEGTNDNVRIEGTVVDTGFSVPANYSTMDTVQWEHWRLASSGSIATVFGANIHFSYIYRFGSSVHSLSSWHYNISLNIATDFRTNNNFSILIENRGEPPIFDSNFTYFFTVFLERWGLDSGSNAWFVWSGEEPPILTLLALVPEFQIKKGCVRTNMNMRSTARTGAGMFSHGSHQVHQGNPDLANSIALYDHHVRIGESEPANQPSIGFYRTDNHQIGILRLARRNNTIGLEVFDTFRGVWTWIQGHDL